MRLFLASALLGGAVVSAAAIPAEPTPTLAPALPLSAFEEHMAKPISLEEAQNKDFNASTEHSTLDTFSISATCTNPRMRKEWDNSSTQEKQDFVNAVKCLMGKPASGQFSIARNRYEDLVALHQSLTENVHNNAKFIIWHRYYLWTFEDVLQKECGFPGALPWFDETKYAGNFKASSIFSNDWFGAADTGGQCVTNGQFANTNLIIGPGNGNGPHCLNRNLNEQWTANTGTSFVNSCNGRTDYADMAACQEGGAHTWGHNGIGGVMSDMYASPNDPLFWLHHAFIDHNYRIWQNQDAGRLGYIDGKDHFGNTLTMSTTVLVGGIRPDKPISDLINTLGDTLCYRYDY